MDSKLTQNCFVPEWLNDLLDGQISSKLSPGRSGETIQHSLLKDDCMHNGLVGRIGYHGDSGGSCRKTKYNKDVFQVNGSASDFQLVDYSQSIYRGLNSVEKKSSFDCDRHSVFTSKDDRVCSSTGINAINSRKDNLKLVKSVENRNALDEEFPSLSGEGASESNGSSYKKASVWDGNLNCREASGSVRSSNIGSESTVKVHVLQTNAFKRVNGMKPAVEQQSVSSSKPATGGRKMTVLGNGNARQKELAPLKSVAKVVTTELESRKSNYMKLGRRDVHEPSRTESCSQNTPVVGRDQKVSKSWAAVVQRSVDTEESADNTSDNSNSGSCSPWEGVSNDVCVTLPENLDFNLEDERRLLYDMGWNEDDQCEELTLEEVNKFLISCPDFSKKWELLIDSDTGENGVVKFILQRRQPPR